jgi:AcrR family transcriptional regulator
VPRLGLTHQRVVAEAAEVADEAGLDHLTLAAVAKRLGVTLPGLYKHIDSLDSLKRDLAVLGVRELTAAISAAAVGRSGRDALHAMAHAYRAYAAAHPGRAAASVRAPGPTDSEHIAAGEAAVAVLLAVLDSYHLDDGDAIDAIRMLRVALHGFTTLEAAGGFGLPQSVDATFTRLVDSLDATFARWAGQPESL